MERTGYNTTGTNKMTVTTSFGEKGELLKLNGNIATVIVRGSLRTIHGTKVFRNGKALA